MRGLMITGLDMIEYVFTGRDNPELFSEAATRVEPIPLKH